MNYGIFGGAVSMSQMLEQAIIDAKALRESAMQNAETQILEKYSEEVKNEILI